MTVNLATAPGLISAVPNSPTDAGAWRLTLNHGRREDLYALWNSVFESTHADRDGLNGRGAAAQRLDQTQGQTQGRPKWAAGVASGTAETEMAVDRSAFAASPTPRSIVTSAEGVSQAPRDPTATLSTTGGRDGATVLQVATRIEASSAPAPGGSDLPLTGGVDRADRTDASITHDWAAAAESSHVFVNGASVEIAVRNPTLSDQDAILSAFETARELTGQRSALLHLTLNGRTIYQQRKYHGYGCSQSNIQHQPHSESDPE